MTVSAMNEFHNTSNALNQEGILGLRPHTDIQFLLRESLVSQEKPQVYRWSGFFLPNQKNTALGEK